MAIPLATAWVKIKPDLKTFPKETEQGIGRARLDKAGDAEGRKFGTRFSSGFKSLMKGALVGTGAILAAGLAGAIIALKDVFQAGREAGQVLRLTQAVIKSTGGAAHVTAKQVFELSQRLSEQSGITDSVIGAGANMLLTFKNVRNEQGKNNDIFNRATTVLVDMTAALRGGDVNSENLRKQAIQLGKALNDPVKGMTALKRVGVTFSDTQITTIKRLVDTGHTLDAQKIILRELTSEFGGAAAATADPIKRFSAAFHNIEEDIGLRLMPILAGMATWLLNTGIPAFDRFWKRVGAPAASKAIGAVRTAWNLLTTGAPAAPAAPAGHAPAKPPEVTGWQKTVLDVRNVILVDIVPAVRVFFAWVSKIWAQLVIVGRQMWPVWKDLWTFLKQVWQAVVILWNAFKPLLGPLLRIAIGLIVLAFKAMGWYLAHILGPAILALAKFVQQIRLSIGKDLDLLAGAWNALTSFLKRIFRSMVMAVLNYLGMIIHGAASAFGWIPGLGGKLKTAANQFDTFKNRVNGALGGLNDKTIHVGVKMAAGHGYTVGGVQTGYARGGPIKGPGGPTADLAGIFALSDHEYVMKAAAHQKYGTAAMDAVNQGKAEIQHRAAGGPAGVSVVADVPSKQVVAQVIGTGFTKVVIAAVQAMIKAGFGAGGAGSSSIVKDAMQWIGRIPYVWGGTAVPGGADCSGFVQTIYSRHGISAPRTSEAQGAWVNRTGPVPGGLAFYYSPGGGPPPGHVAIVAANRNMAISQGGGMGPQYTGLRSMPLMFTGVPPGGFRKMAGGGQITEPVLGIGRSGAAYSFGENGDETVVPGRLSTGGIEARLDALIRLLERAPTRTAAGVGDALNGAARGAARRAPYRTR